jgi:polygalacturonase
LSAASASRHVVTDFGAKGDGRTLNTLAINRAIEACHEAGGGVVVPPGTFLTGTLRLLSHVQLHLEAGAVLKGSTNLADYQLDGVRRGLVFAFEATDVALTGLGTIDGSSDAFFDPQRMHGFRNLGFDRRFTRQGDAYMPPDTVFDDGPIYYEQRPGTMIQMFRCERVVVENLRFLSPPEWTFRFGDCDDVLVHGITIRANLKVPNSDGIHLTTSRNVRISDCNLSCGDDTIAVTGFGDETGPAPPAQTNGADYRSRRMGNRTGYCENITVANCTPGIRLDGRARGLRAKPDPQLRLSKPRHLQFASRAGSVRARRREHREPAVSEHHNPNPALQRPLVGQGRTNSRLGHPAESGGAGRPHPPRNLQQYPGGF